MKCPLLLVAVVFIASAAATASAQYIFLDTTGDGLCDFPFEPLGAAETAVDIWIDTGANEDGSTATCPTGEALTISSYEIVLYSPGTIQIGSWTNAIPQFTEDLGTLHEGSWVRVGFTSSGGATHLPPGKYRLGTVGVAIAGVCPSLMVAASREFSGSTHYTQFYSACPGQDGVNFMKLGVDFTDTCSAGPLCSAVKSTSTTWGKIKEQYR